MSNGAVAAEIGDESKTLAPSPNHPNGVRLHFVNGV